MSRGELLRDQFSYLPDSLFHTAQFHRLHRGERAGGFFEWCDGGEVRAAIHFTDVGEGLWRSPGRGTFAGPLVDPDLPLAEVAAFLAAVTGRLVAEGARRAEILLAPQAHDPVAFARTTYLLRSAGFSVSACDLNYSLEVDRRGFAERVSYGNRKRLNKAAREGYLAASLSPSRLPQVYETLRQNREGKGYALSMSLQQLEDMQRLFPDRLLLFGTAKGEELAAAAVCLRLTADVLYVFYWGDRPGHSAVSPVVALAECIYRWCQDHGVRLLDAGTSTEDIVPNHGLIQFKRGLGFTESLKLRMEKSL